ncbi:hypothetical protein BH11CYA1_BH11CYA1_48210 [soil metagenome]
MGNDKPVCESREHIKQAEVVRDSNRGFVDWVMDEIGLPKEDADLKKVACIPKEQYEDSIRPKLKPDERAKVSENVYELKSAVLTGDLTKVGELFNRLAPRAGDKEKVTGDEFAKRPGVKIADETFYQLNKELDKHGIDFDYRAMGVYSGDRSPSLIISREHKVDANTTEHLEVTLQGGTSKDYIKHSGAERVMIRDYGGPDAPPTEYQRTAIASTGNKTSAETAYQEIMKPYLASQRK